MPAFSIVGDLLLRTGSFVTDSQRAEKSLRSLKKEALDTFAVFKASFAGGLAVGAVTELTRQLSTIPGLLGDIVREAGNFQDIGERIGDAAVDVAGFAVALHVAGSSAEELADFSVKLTKGLSKIDDESKGAGAALAALGIPLEQFKALRPVEQIEALAKALDGFAGGPEQTAVLEALVKGGSRLLPFLKELEQQGGRQNILTAEQIRLADDYADRQARSSAQLKAYAQIAATEALPAVTALQNVFKDLVKELLTANSAQGAFSGQSAIQQWAQEAALFIAKFIDSLRGAAADIKVFVATTEKEFANLRLLDARAKDALTRASTLGFKDASADVTAALEARNKAVADANKALTDRLALDTNKVQDLVRKQFSASLLTGERFNASTDPRSTTFGTPLKPRIDTSGLVSDTGAKDDPTKKLLENQLKALEAIIKREQDLLQTRNRFLDLFNAQGLISIKDYYDAQLTIIESATTAQLAALDKQIAATKKARDAATKQTDRAEFQGKLDAQIEARSKLEQESGAKAIEISIKRADAERAYQEQIKGVSASLLELQGNLAAAAAIKFDQQNLKLFNEAMANGDQRALDMLASLKKAAISQAEFTKATTDAQREFQKLSDAEERVAIARLAGSKSELGALEAIGKARAEQIPILEAEVQALEAIAKASGQASLVQQADQARLALERLKATVDPFGDRFREIFTDSATGALTDFITGTKTASQAFKAFADSVLQQISRIIAQNFAENLFGKGSGGGDLIGGLFGSIFGSGGKSSGGGDVSSGIAGQVGSDLLSAIFGGGLARGGDVLAGREYNVGEFGPEKFRPRVNGTIIPNDQMNGGGRPLAVTNNFVLQGNPSTDTQAQIATKVGQGIQRAMARGNA